AQSPTLFLVTRFILASASPRRADLLRAAGFQFDVVVGTADEARYEGELAEAYVARVAEAKAATVAPQAGGLGVLAADTTVVVEGQILGKPHDDADARRMLRLLSGRTHQVMTGVTLAVGSASETAVEVTQVTFSRLSGEELESYIMSGEPQDKA